MWDGLGVQFGLLFLLKDSFVKFVVVVLLIHFSVRIRLIENSMELRAISESPEERVDGAYVGYKSLHQPVGMLHIRHNHEEIVVRCSQQVWAKYDSQRVCRHLVVLFVVSHPTVRVDQSHISVGGKEMNRLLVEMFNNTFEEIKIMSRQRLNYSSNPFYPSIEVLDLCDSENT